MVLVKHLFYFKSDLFRHIGNKTRIFSPYLQQTSAFSSQSIENAKTKKFEDFLPKVIDCAVSHPRIADIFGFEEWLRKLLTYNVSGGKCARGKTVTLTYEILERSENITAETMELSNILGWCLEMNQAFLMVLDDVMDVSKKRRGKPCWYKLPEVGPNCATNDSLLCLQCMFYVLKQYFGEKKYYKDLLDTINEIMLLTNFGQHLDIKISENKSKDYNHFTSDIYLSIIKYKSAFYTYDLPTKLGLLLANYNASNDTKELMRDISIGLGTLFQIQDDYLDCYGDEKLTGKQNHSADIQEGKCTWLAVNALQRCTPKQRIVFTACYGSSEPAHLERCKQLYQDLKLPELYNDVEGKYYSDLSKNINKLPTRELMKLFQTLLEMTYKRKK